MEGVLKSRRVEEKRLRYSMSLEVRRWERELLKSCLKPDGAMGSTQSASHSGAGMG